jgi:phospholipid-binding lipoprotein MlaA
VIDQPPVPLATRPAPTHWRLPGLIATLLLAGCASQAQRVAEMPVGDPYEPLNRKVFAFNDSLDRNVLRPTAVGWKKGTPPQFRTGLGNAIDNALYPVTIVNAFLQGKFAQSGRDLGRFVLNTTVGLLGLFDPATEAGLPANQEDFGQTLNTWGVPQGPFLMVPLLGPRTVSSGVGNLADLPLSPYFNLSDNNLRWGLFAIDLVNTRSGLLDLDQALREAYDPYVFLRDAYLQNRAYRIADGALLAPEPDDYEDYDMGGDEPADAAAP